MLIAVEGCFGAGKTTVAKGLALHRKSEILLENFESNPFLRAFYENPTANAFETEFSFLLLHYHQLKRYKSSSPGPEIVSDFHLAKDLLYADLNLNDAHAKRVFTELYELCLEKAIGPNVLVYLSASTELLLERIRLRDRDFESLIDFAYCAAVNEAYEELFRNHTGKKIRIEMAEWNFVKDVTLYQRLSGLIDGVAGDK